MRLTTLVFLSCDPSWEVISLGSDLSQEDLLGLGAPAEIATMVTSWARLKPASGSEQLGVLPKHHLRHRARAA